MRLRYEMRFDVHWRIMPQALDGHDIFGSLVSENVSKRFFAKSDKAAIKKAESIIAARNNWGDGSRAWKLRFVARVLKKTMPARDKVRG